MEYSAERGNVMNECLSGLGADLNRLKEDLIRDEDMRRKPYTDSVGKMTIGVGRNLDDVGITETEALMLLDNDIRRLCMSPALHSIIDRHDSVRQEALLNMAFNIGITRLLMFKKMIAALDEFDYGKAADEMVDSRWYMQVGARADRLVYMVRHGKRMQ